MATQNSLLLRRLEATRLEYGPGQSAVKLSLLAELERRRLKSARDVLRLHEHLCFMRAYPDDRRLHRKVVAMLGKFAGRSDLKRHRDALADTGIAGTVIHFRFFWPTARWLAVHWPRELQIDWLALENDQPIATALKLLVTPLEANWLRLADPEPQEALKRLAGSRIGDGTFLARRVEAMPGDHYTREAFFDGLDVPFRLLPGSETPSRTLTHNPSSPLVFSTPEPRRGRPDLLRAMERPPQAVRTVTPQEGERLIALARVAMATRERDLDNFAYGDCRDVRMVDDGDGLQWILIGTLPERRPVLRATYGMLTLRNGVPIGYVGADTLFGCVDISYNTFPTFRGGEAAHVLGRMLAAFRVLFGARSFTIEPYQLGHGNSEAIDSGAWWFYYKLGFRPRNAAIRSLARAELKRMKRRPDHLSSARTLRLLAADYLYFELPGNRAPFWLRLAEFGKVVAGQLALRGGADREGSLAYFLNIVEQRLKLAPPKNADKNILAAWRNWAALLALLPGIKRWSAAERNELAAIVSAKGGRRETDFLLRFNAHPKLGALLRRVTGC